ncbi:MAG: hypothetical protein HY054_05900 [Proteobacteria bacterium]|nr:hypothetical protein [Pseudomonadota bacterium]
MSMRLLAAFAALALVSCAPPAPPAPSLNALAEQYVRASLEMGTHEDGYIDAYYGPPQWKTEAEAHPRTTAQLKAAMDQLHTQVEAAEHAAIDPAVRRRAHTLAAYVASARYRLDMMDGARAPFADEAEHLFALRPEIRPLSYYDAVLARVESMVPGAGDLATRVEALRNRYIIPRARLEAVMNAAINECRRRTLAHIPLPQSEHFALTFVNHQSWSAYNYYHGANQSEIQVNTDQPIAINRAVGLGCHEGYPGHHVQGIYAEKLYRENGYVESSIAPLFSPQGPLNEGGGNYGVELAFPGQEKLQFEQVTLYPLAGLNPATAPAFDALNDAMKELDGARLTIAQQYLDHQISRDQAIALIAHYQLVSRDRAAQAVAFIDHYRSYVINYVSGEDLIRAYANRQGADNDAHWRVYISILSQPTLPSDLQ